MLAACDTATCSKDKCKACDAQLRLTFVDAKTGAGVVGVKIDGVVCSPGATLAVACAIVTDVPRTMHFKLSAPGYVDQDIDIAIPANPDAACCGCAVLPVAKKIELVAVP